ncbi:hypothetical protein A2704_03975 [Candidatus Kaiserbacteria bacterium RIFCSPHIGHO2_01_FULL_54_36b]|nr:MAG: hypothetical protein A2704_03975 [Candidatus Kaiserbacteria bacterium RIFCSPHIGHO2_01_FULL_54_36b]
MQLWAIGVSSVSDLTAHNTDSLRKLLAESLNGSAAAHERIEKTLADIHAAMRVQNASLKPDPRPEPKVVEKSETQPQKRGRDFEPDHEWLDKVNEEAPRLNKDPLDPFYRDMKRYSRLLSRDEQTELGRSVREEKDEKLRMKARDILILHNLRLVLWIARKHLWATIAKKKEWSSLQLSDLVQEGTLGLMIAAERYDERKGFAFTTYAIWWIRSTISRAILDSGFIRVPVHMGELISKVRRAMNEIALREGRPPTIEEIGIAVEQDPKKVRQALKVAQVSASMVSLNDVIITDDSSEAERHEFIACEAFLRPDRALEAKQELDGACERLNRLTEMLYEDESISERNREMFVRFYGLDGSVTKKTLEHVAEGYGVTRELVRQVVGACWVKIQHAGLDMDHESVLTDLARIGELEKLAGKRVSAD